MPTPQTSTSPGRSFGQAIRSVTGIGAYTMLLNPWLISYPYPDKPKAQTGMRTISISDTGICNKLAALNADYAASGSTAGLYNWLANKYGTAMTLSAAQFAEVQQSCGNCKFLIAEDVTLPVFMDPGATGCVLPSAFATAQSDLTTAFGGTLNTADTLYRTIYTNYMNQRWGFSLGYDDYQNYQTKLLADPSAILCNTPSFSTIYPDPYQCIKDQMATAVYNGRRDYNDYIEEQKRLFRLNYIQTCSAARAEATMEANQQEYHYTLYYYDQADNLVRTIPPEGVQLLSATQVGWVQNYRNTNAITCTAPVYEPTVNSDTTVAFNALSNTMTGTTGTRAVELWLYYPGTGTNQVIAETPDRKYLFSVSIKNNLMQVEIDSTTQSSAHRIKFLFTDRVTMDISNQLPLNPWVHVVIQGSRFAHGPLSIYLNGILQTPMSSRMQHTLARWNMKSTTAGTVSFPVNRATLKHLRLYNRAMTTAEITTNANDNCLLPSDTTAMRWYRFNIPAPGGPTTINDSSTIESRINPIYPNHTLRTTYVCNSTNQVNKQQSPDGGTNRFWYDLLSRLVVSRNDKQLPDSNYSYTQYDALGRISEVGQKHQTSLYIGNPDYLADATVSSFNSVGTNSQITHTYYDTIPGGVTLKLRNLRKRVAASYYSDVAGTPVNQTFYSYDLDGNVKTLWQKVGALDTKRIDYEYDLISGKVNFVRYQDGKPDHFYYQYAYDADNRLTHAWKGLYAIVDSLNGSTILPEWKKLDAYYQYYLHGPLARVEIGDEFGKVQGIDYAYTLQGWLKGVNGNTLTPTTDMGGDGINGTANNNIARDAYAYSLGYHHADYKPVSTTAANPFQLIYQPATGDITGNNLYNGNISNTTLAISQFNSGNPVGYTYKYDQLNRLKQTRQHNGISGTGWNSSSITNAYAESFTYDGNGNLLTQNRNDTSGVVRDNLTYARHYINGHLTDNRLNSLQNGTSNYTYTYDAIGERTSDSKNGLSNIDWTVYGKLRSITKAGSTINYTYDVAGQRVSKTTGTTTTYYIKDAKGNTLAEYDNQGGANNWNNQQLYGSEQLGLWTPATNLSAANAEDKIKQAWYTKGYTTNYYLKNHLGNVIATISDRRVQHSTDGTTVDYMNADLVNATDNYSFGLPQPNRQYGGLQKYGFNGKENDNDVGNSQNYGMREYDLFANVFDSVDPLADQYPELTPYQFGSNNPVLNIDLDGLEGKNVNKKAFVNPPLTPPVISPPVAPVGGLVAEQVVEKVAPGAGVFATLTAIFTMIPVPTDGHNERAQEVKIAHTNYVSNAIRNNYEIITTDPSTLPDQYLYQVRERLATGKAYTSDYKYAKEANVRFGGQNVSDIPDGHGVVYLRIDKTGKLKPYIGQAKSRSRYEARQEEHRRDNPESDFRFYIITTGVSGNDLTHKEQQAIDAYGGVTNKKNPDGGTSNQRNPGKSLPKQNTNGGG